MNRLLRVFPLLTGIGLSLVTGAVSCAKVPLLAPTGTVINLTVQSATAALNSSVNIIAVLIENGQQGQGGTGTTATSTSQTGAGTPVQDGTVVSFSTSIGTIEPAEVKTVNGKVSVVLKTSGESGTATITAYSGGAKSTAQIKIGAANAKTVTVSASPQNLPSTGGTSVISALVVDENGNGLAGATVIFTTDKGSLSSASALTNQNGIATATLTTTGAAKVNATINAITGTVNVGLASAASLKLQVPTAVQTISTPVSFTVSNESTSSVRLTNVSISYGDGATQPIGVLSGSQTVTHFYSSTGIFNITVSGLDPDGVPATQFGQIAVTGLTIDLTPPSTTLGVVPRNTLASFVAKVTPGTPSIQYYDWDFGDGTTGRTVSATTTHVYQTTDAFPAGATVVNVRVTAVPLYGSSVSTFIQLPIGG